MGEYETIQTETEREPKDLVDVEMRKLTLALEELDRVRVEKRRWLEVHYDEMLDALMREKVVKMEEMEQEAREKQEKLEREAKEKVNALKLRIEAEFAEQLLVDPIPGLPLLPLHQQSSQDKSLSREDLDALSCYAIVEQSVMLETFLKEVEQEADEDEIVDESFDKKAGGPLLPLAPTCPVCFEQMSPPTRIFQCGGGHLLCGQCRPRIQVGDSAHASGTSIQGICLIDMWYTTKYEFL